MIHTDEDDEFERIAHEAEMKRGQPYYFKSPKDDDDDIQDYVRPWVGLTDEEINQLGLSNYRQVVREVEQALKERNT